MDEVNASDAVEDMDEAVALPCLIKAAALPFRWYGAMGAVDVKSSGLISNSTGSLNICHSGSSTSSQLTRILLGSSAKDALEKRMGWIVVMLLPVAPTMPSV
jgi:hypothetical protein